MFIPLQFRTIHRTWCWLLLVDPIQRNSSDEKSAKCALFIILGLLENSDRFLLAAKL